MNLMTISILQRMPFNLICVRRVNWVQFLLAIQLLYVNLVTIVRNNIYYVHKHQLLPVRVGLLVVWGIQSMNVQLFSVVWREVLKQSSSVQQVLRLPAMVYNLITVYTIFHANRDTQVLHVQQHMIVLRNTSVVRVTLLEVLCVAKELAKMLITMIVKLLNVVAQNRGIKAVVFYVREILNLIAQLKIVVPLTVGMNLVV
jgi:hypothetical protein